MVFELAGKERVVAADGVAVDRGDEGAGRVATLVLSGVPG